MPIRLGLCKFNMYDISGLAINEAVIQLIISVIFEHEQEYNIWKQKYCSKLDKEPATT